MRLHGWLLVTALGALGTAVFYFYAQSTRHAPKLAVRDGIVEVRARQVDVEAELHALRTEFEQLKAEQTPARVVDPSASSNARITSGLTGTPTSPLITENQRAKNRRLADEAGNKLDSVLRGETVDRQWDSHTLEIINKTFSGIRSSRISEADCRTRLCRIVVEHDSLDDQKQLAKSILGSPPFDQDVLFRYDVDSSPPRTILYVARDGYALRNLVQSN